MGEWIRSQKGLRSPARHGRCRVREKYASREPTFVHTQVRAAGAPRRVPDDAYAHARAPTRPYSFVRTRPILQLRPADRKTSSPKLSRILVCHWTRITTRVPYVARAVTPRRARYRLQVTDYGGGSGASIDLCNLR